MLLEGTLVVSGLVSLVCERHLWRRKARVARKLRWCPVILLPVFGPILYGSLFHPPPPSTADPDHGNVPPGTV